MIAVVLFVVALVVRAAVGTAFAGPAYPDSYYYVNVAQQLAAGHGFTIDYIWNFVDVGGTLPAAPSLPIPSNGHWMPLAALVQVPFIWLLGPTWLASELPMWIVGAWRHRSPTGSPARSGSTSASRFAPDCSPQSPAR